MTYSFIQVLDTTSQETLNKVLKGYRVIGIIPFGKYNKILVRKKILGLF